MKVLVCGGRDFTNKHFIYDFLDSRKDITHVIHGGARGADRLAQNWAIDREINVDCFLANWEKYGKSAGVIRNKQMLDEGKPDYVIAFPGGKGTENMISQARRAEIPVIVPLDAYKM